MDSSNESITLLSTMSPKIRNKLLPGQKRFRRVAGASILALKGNLRRSSLHQKSVATHKNEELNLIDHVSSTESCDSEKWNILNETPIVISDSDDPFDEMVEKIPDMPKAENVRKCSLSEEKMNAIEHWIAKLNVEENSTNSTIFSELSTIQGENFVHEGIGLAINSTFATPISKRFDELFRNNKLKISSDDDKRDVLENPENLVIEDSFEERINKNQNIFTSPKLNQESPKSDAVFQHDDLTSTKSNKNSPTNTNVEYEDMENVLDKLYGNSWRAKRELVLPKTEPKKNKKKPNLTLQVNSERKPKLSPLFRNPYLDSFNAKPNNLWKKSQVSTILTKLKDLCDSDKSSDNSPIKAAPETKLTFNSNITDDCGNKIPQYSKNDTARMKLDFCPDITDDEEDDTTSKYFKNRTPEYNSPQDLEEKTKNNVTGYKNKIKDPTSAKKIRKKYMESQKENIDSPLKRKNTKNTPRKQNISRSNSSDSSGHAARNDDLNYSSTSDDEWEEEISKIDHSSTLVNGKYSFLASLSKAIPISQCDMSARIYRNNFKNFRDQLTKKLFMLYNENIFDNSIPQDTSLEWNERLLNTAGQCYCKKITRRCGTLERSVRIVLSNKVLDSAERLRDTLVHEMCHAATWIVNCVSDGHGKYWKSWAYKAMKTFPELPPISRCHNYVISTKYTYKCTGCGYSIGRHSKSLDIERKRCGYCHGKFEVLINKTTKKGVTKSVPATPKKEATGFALFVKENYGIYKTPDKKHGDVMKILGQKFQNMKMKT